MKSKKVKKKWKMKILSQHADWFHSRKALCLRTYHHLLFFQYLNIFIFHSPPSKRHCISLVRTKSAVLFIIPLTWLCYSFFLIFQILIIDFLFNPDVHYSLFSFYPRRDWAKIHCKLMNIAVFLFFVCLFVCLFHLWYFTLTCDARSIREIGNGKPVTRWRKILLTNAIC